DAGENEVGPVLKAGGWEPAERHPEQEDQHDAEPEARQRLAEHGEERAEVVVAGASPDSGDDADSHAGNDRQDHGAQRELDGCREPLPYDGQSRRAVLEGLTKITSENASQEDPILDVERLLQPQLTVQFVDGGLRRALGE